MRIVSNQYRKEFHKLAHQPLPDIYPQISGQRIPDLTGDERHSIETLVPQNSNSLETGKQT
jgi:hypothetical protein